ncbi:MAG: flagellar biosynthesis anti-sigma factor FlgM [Thermodesulfobacteriota bacterium]
MRVRDGFSGGSGAPQRAAPRSRPEPVGFSGAGQAGDAVRLTGRSAEIHRARALALGAPEVREPLVRRLADDIARGAYRVEGARVLEVLLREHGFEARG